jgi:hypothetical protein
LFRPVRWQTCPALLLWRRNQTDSGRERRRLRQQLLGFNTEAQSSQKKKFYFSVSLRLCVIRKSNNSNKSLWHWESVQRIVRPSSSLNSWKKSSDLSGSIGSNDVSACTTDWRFWGNSLESSSILIMMFARPPLRL